MRPELTRDDAAVDVERLANLLQCLAALIMELLNPPCLGKRKVFIRARPQAED
jgi:hypothetical protein